MDGIIAEGTMEITMNFIKLNKDDILFQGIMCYIFDKNTKEEIETIADDNCFYSFNRKEKSWKYLNLNNINKNQIFSIDDIKDKGVKLNAFYPTVINKSEMLEAIKNEEVNYK